jgi:hypothetical protein
MKKKKKMLVAGLGLFVLLLVVACKPNPSECLDKGDEKACQALCDTGKPELLNTCYEMRAREALSCADGKGDCTKACENWKTAQSTDNIKGFYVAKLGSTDKVTALSARCAAAKK